MLRVESSSTEAVAITCFRRGISHVQHCSTSAKVQDQNKLLRPECWIYVADSIVLTELKISVQHVPHMTHHSTACSTSAKLWEIQSRPEWLKKACCYAVSVHMCFSWGAKTPMHRVGQDKSKVINTVGL